MADDGFEAAKQATVTRFPTNEVRQGTFKRTPQGVFKEVELKGNEPEREWRWLCSYLEVAAETRNHRGEAWGRLLNVRDRDGAEHEWAMPMELLAGSGEEYRRHLLSLGLLIAPGTWARSALHGYISVWHPEHKARCVERTGWHDGDVFVLPDRTFGEHAGERVLLQGAVGSIEPRVCGTLEGWQNGVAKPAVGNPRLALWLSAAFAPPLLKPIGEESGGFHLRGGSSTGKTTIQRAAVSAWGVDKGSWRTTDNAGEGLAYNACDCLLGLDEISQADPRAVDALVYMLANERGKGRMRRDAGLRRARDWRVLFLSTGEVGVPAVLAEAGRRVRAGQEVRILEIPADAGKGYGAFEALHGLATSRAFAESIAAAAAAHQGHAARAFLAKLVADPDRLAEQVHTARDAWLQEVLKDHPGADGQVQRAAKRFGLVAAAGELATRLKILPWPKGEASRAATACFAAWLEHRGGVEPQEVREGIAQVRLFLAQHGKDRFEPAWLPKRVDRDAHEIEPRVPNRAGFRREVKELEVEFTDDTGNRKTELLRRWEYFVLPEVWRREVCKGHDARLVHKALIERGLALGGEGRNLLAQARVPGVGKARVVHLLPALLEDPE